MNTGRKTRRLAALTLAAALLLPSCGGGSGGAAATTMHLKRSEGTVGVADGEGKSVEPKENLGLYSGYGVDTQSESYAWIDLDEVKLTKLDQDSEIAIKKEDKHLEIEVLSGSLFFNVTEPLEEDETMEICTSSMVVGIRGTCGWVGDNTAALLEGTVTVTAGEQEVTVNAGEMATLTAEGTLEVKPLSAVSVPAFVKAEIEDDDALAEEIEAASGIDVLTPVDPIYLRYMYTYSRSRTYTADGQPRSRTEYFPNEQGRIGKSVHYYFSNGDETTVHLSQTMIYIYDDDGALQAEERSDGYVSTVTENTADHMTRVHESGKTIGYYDEQGRLVRRENFKDGTFNSSTTYTYDAEGKLIRSDNYGPDGTPGNYTLYEYD